MKACARWCRRPQAHREHQHVAGGNIEQMRVFYLEYQITQTVSAELQVNSETISRNLPVADFQLSWSSLPFAAQDRQ